MDNNEGKISKFNSGVNIIIRIGNLWNNCHSFKRNGRYSKWNEELDSIWLELARDIKPTDYYDVDNKGKMAEDEKSIDKLGYKTQFDGFDHRLKELMPFKDSGSTGFERPSKEDIEKRNKQYKVLMEKHLFLARLENDLGKGTSWEEEDDDF